MAAEQGGTFLSNLEAFLSEVSAQSTVEPDQEVDRDTDRYNFPLGHRQKRAMELFLEPNESNTGFKFGNTREILVKLYEPSLIGLSPQERAKKLKSYEGTLYRQVKGNNRLREFIEGEDIPPLSEFLSEIKERYPVYGNTPVRDLARILRREIPFPAKETTIFESKTADAHPDDSSEVLNGDIPTLKAHPSMKNLPYMMLQLTKEGKFQYPTVQEALKAIKKRDVGLIEVVDAINQLEAFIEAFIEYEDAPPKDRPPQVGRMWLILNNPLYELFSGDDIARILRRQKTAEEILDLYYSSEKPNGKIVLTPAEKYRLFNLISELPPKILRLLNIEPDRDYKEALKLTLGQLEKIDPIIEQKAIHARGSLRQKIEHFFTDPALYVSSATDPDIKRILELLSNVQKRHHREELLRLIFLNQVHS